VELRIGLGAEWRQEELFFFPSAFDYIRLSAQQTAPPNYVPSFRSPIRKTTSIHHPGNFISPFLSCGVKLIKRSSMLLVTTSLLLSSHIHVPMHIFKLGRMLCGTDLADVTSRELSID
jgi:hypothetical protein